MVNSTRAANDRTIESVVREGLCTGCGTCVGICPVNAVDMVIDRLKGIYIPRLDRPTCTNCGLCSDACPGRDPDFKQLNLGVFGKEPEDVLLGNYLNCYIAHATDHDIRYNSTSGGMVTATLLHALETKLIDGALVTRMAPGRDLQPQTFIARTKEEVTSAARSKYCPVPANTVLKEILKSEAAEKFAVVGLPCHIQGVRKAEAMSAKLRQKITLHLGLFCAHTDAFQQTDFLLRRHAICPEQVSYLEYRGRGWPGNMTVTTKAGSEILIPYKEFLVLHSSWLFIPHSCTLCSDGLGDFADISFGDPWLPELKNEKVGNSVVVTRSEMGDRLLRDIASKGPAKAEETTAAIVVRSQIGLLYSKKKVIKARARLSHRNACNPSYSLSPSPLEYLIATYQQVSASLLTSRPYLSRVLQHMPTSVFRLCAAPLFLARRFQMGKIIRQRYPSP